MGNLADMIHLHPAAPDSALQRLLIPLDASAESRWGLRHAELLAATGRPLDICLLFVAEPVRRWEVLRFYREDEVRQHFQARAAVFLDEAAATLQQAGLPCRRFFREADPVGGILDLAEELQCTTIVVPATHCLGLFPTGLGRKLLNRQGSTPITRVGADGSTVV